MFLADCPNCRKPILIPGNHMKAVAQCPLCEYEFSVEGIASSEVPIAEILRSDFSTIDGDAKQSSDQSLDFDLDREKAPVEAETALAKSEEPRPNFDFVDESDRGPGASDAVMTQAVASPFSGADGESAATPPKTSVAASRSVPRRGRNPLVEIFKVLGGGIAGLAIAQLILWWLPGTWRRDPLSLAPQLPTFAAFAAPESLRFPNRKPTQPGDNTTPPSPTPGEDFPRLPPNESDIDLGNAGLNADLPTEPDNQANDADGSLEDHDETGTASEPETTAPGPPNDTSPEERPSASIDDDRSVAEVNPPITIPSDDGTIDDDTIAGDNTLSVDDQNNDLDDNDDPPVTPSEDTEPKYVGLIDPPLISNEEFSEALNAATALTAAMGTDPNQRPGTKARQQFYIRLAKLGLAATYRDVPTTNSDELAKTAALLTAIGNDRFKFNLIGASVTGWLKYSGRDTEGVVIAGYARQVQPLGDLFVTKVELAGKPDRFMNVLSKSDPRQDQQMPIATDQAVVILGIISDEPTEQIAGYESEATQVIWQGVHVTLNSPPTDQETDD